MNLSPTQHDLALIAACTATGDQSVLKARLNQAFDKSSLSLNQAKSAIEQLYAYCGFPRCLNALGTLMAVVSERETQGKATAPGSPATPIPAGTDLNALGERVQTQLAGRKVAGALFDFSPQIDRYLKAHLFGDIFADDRLTYQEREVVTIAALGSMSGVQSQFAAHIDIGRNTGLSDTQIDAIKELIGQLQTL